jgi:tRNA U34 5-carboxymethylaminomethyl modifying GTPase MnmE/TrmE
MDSLISLEPLFGELFVLVSDIKNSRDMDLGLLLSLSESISFELEGLIGAIPADDLLGDIFSKFCIGK